MVGILEESRQSYFPKSIRVLIAAQRHLESHPTH